MGEVDRGTRGDDLDLCGSGSPGERLVLGLAEHDGAAGSHDGELLARDRLPGRSEDLRVLEPDVGEDHHDRPVEDVGRVKATPEAGLDDRGGHVPRF